MLPEIGNLFIHLVLILELVCFFLLCIKCDFYEQVKYISHFCTILIMAAFGILVYGYATSDFSMLTVVTSSHTTNSLMYKIAASWSTHEGSMLLWNCYMALFTSLFIVISPSYSKLTSHTVLIQTCLNILFVAFTTLNSNPFVRIFPAPLDGIGFNPVLQDVALLIHPPILYLGYISTSMLYSITVAACLVPNQLHYWYTLIKPWIYFSWSFLTAGIALGSWWAYREIGWGGFWFWDPVENASLMPWLAMTALLHLMPMVKRCKGRWLLIAMCLSLLCFTLTVVGTFIVRSGLISSVHSFATDSNRGVAILAALFVVMLLATMALFRSFKTILQNKNEDNNTNLIIQKQHYLLIIINTIITACILLIVLLGTFLPLAAQLILGLEISTDPHYFNTLLGPFGVGIVVCCIIVIAWIGGYTNIQNNRYINMLPHFCIAIASVAAIINYGTQISQNANQISISNFVILAGFGFSMMLYSMTIQMLCRLISSKLWHHSSKFLYIWGHLGIVTIISGISICSYLGYEEQKVLWPTNSNSTKSNNHIMLNQYAITLVDIGYYKETNYVAKVMHIKLTDQHNPQNIHDLYPELRSYGVEKKNTVETAIFSQPLYDIYIVVNQTDFSDDIIVSAYYRPGINMIWLGAAILFLCGIYRAAQAVVTLQQLKSPKLPSH